MQHLEKSEKKEHYLTHSEPIDSFDNVLYVSEEDAYKYLRGEVLRDKDVGDGWVVIAYEGLGLGWGKAKNKVVKNHYPKGLRNL